MARDEVLVTDAVLWSKQCFVLSEGLRQESVPLFPSVSLPDGDTAHASMLLQTVSHMGSRANAGPCQACGRRGCGHLSHHAFRWGVGWAGRIKQMFTNDLTRGSICLQEQCAATLSCTVSWLDISKPHRQSSYPNSVPRRRISFGCAAPSETAFDGSKLPLWKVNDSSPVQR